MRPIRHDANPGTWTLAFVVTVIGGLVLATGPSLAAGPSSLLAGPPTVTLALQAGSDSGSSQADNVTNVEALTYDVVFDRAVTGLDAGDFSFTGTATGCAAGAPTGSGAAYQLTVTACSSGTVILGLDRDTVTDGAAVSGPAARTTAPTVVVDRTKPTATAPSAAIRAGVTLAGTAIPVRLSWTGADDVSGVDRYELERRIGDNPDESILAADLTSPAYDVIVGSASTVRFSARTVDKAGNVGDWAFGPFLAPRLSQETSSVLVYRGVWSTARSSPYSAGAARFATAFGASATYTFIGRNVALVTTRAPSRGRVRVYVDGAYATTVDLAGAIRYRSLVWQRKWALAARHVVRFVVLGTAGRPRVDLDAVAVVR